MVNGVASIPIAVSASASKLLPGDSTQRGRFSGSYLIGPENLCLNKALQSLVCGQRLPASPLYLFGRSQVGKTHLASGLAHRWMEFFDRRDVQYVTATAFYRDWVTACRADRVSVFRNKYRRVRLLVLEDVDRFPSRGNCQMECIHTIDAVHQSNGMVVVTARVDPWHVSTWIPTLRSRLYGGFVVRIKPPEYATRLALGKQLAGDRRGEPSEAKLPALSSSMDSPGTTAETVPQLSENGDEAGAEPSAAECHRQIQRKVPDINAIVSVTAAFYEVKPVELRNKTRRKTLVLARSVAMYLAREWTGESFQRIGRLIGRRDHSTALYSYRKIERLLRTDTQIQNDLCAIRQSIERRMNCE